MTITTPTTQRSAPGIEELLDRFRPVLDEIAAGSVRRESDRELAHDAVRRLAESGFTALRVPTEHHGLGASLADTFHLLARLGEADPNLVQALRAHFTAVENFRAAGPAAQERWFPRIVAGEVFGNATTERGNRPRTNETRLEQRDGGWILNGTKYYSTGSLYADWIQVTADLPTGETRRVTVHRGDRGVELVDDWDGFGQRLTASGTTRLLDVAVDPQNIAAVGAQEGYGTLTSFVQMVLLAALTGIGRAVRRDAVEFVRNRTRAYAHGVGDEPQRDPLVQETVGRISATVFAVESAFDSAARRLDGAVARSERGELTADDQAELDTVTSEAQIVIIEQVLAVATQLFEVGGASATTESRRLDRHWRNARVLGSHNPLAYRAREVGQQRLTGDAVIAPVYIGSATPHQSHRVQETTP
ncbi:MULTISPECIES: acyl-CoA dehydrogenase family protein [Citricoccus]|uniref:acyl-CoA dehydrogenase family protein n=1 Tax=Citricoccus TaxID=169133 RepID=UPI000255E142|nr:acyl-CoA dehydrogenase family protein [Citricoccus sp. CH26A]